MFAAVLGVCGVHNGVLHAVVVSFLARQVLTAPLPPLADGVFLLVVAHHARQWLGRYTSAVAVVAYTVADVYAERAATVFLRSDTRLALAFSLAVAVYLVDVREYGCAGDCLFRTAKFFIVKELVTYTVETGALVVYGPLFWLAAVLVAVSLIHTVADARVLALLDTVVHAAASTLAVSFSAQTFTLSRFEVCVLAAGAHTVATAMPRHPARDLARSVVILLAIIQLATLGLLPVAVLLVVATPCADACAAKGAGLELPVARA